MRRPWDTVLELSETLCVVLGGFVAGFATAVWWIAR